MLMDFSGDTMQISTLYTDMEYYETNASACDTAGNLLFYTNGIHIRDQSHQIMAGWDTLNTQANGGHVVQQQLPPTPRGIDTTQTGSDSLYYLFHASFGLYDQFEIVVRGNYLYYTLINISRNNGLGEIIDLNHVLVDDFLDYGKVNASATPTGAIGGYSCPNSTAPIIMYFSWT